jgi:hypothetical protein
LLVDIIHHKLIINILPSVDRIKIAIAKVTAKTCKTDRNPWTITATISSKRVFHMTIPSHMHLFKHLWGWTVLISCIDHIPRKQTGECSFRDIHISILQFRLRLPGVLNSEFKQCMLFKIGAYVTERDTQHFDISQIILSIEWVTSLYK